MSSLWQDLEEYLAVRRALGTKLADSERPLRKFVAFITAQGERFITIARAVQWARDFTKGSPAHQAARLSIVRLFARYLHAKDSRHVVPPFSLLPHRPQRTIPYLYSEAEVRALLGAARDLPSRCGLRGDGYAVLLGLLAVTGLRISEALALDRKDVDLFAGIVTVRTGKFGKARLIPVHASTRKALKAYAGRRDLIISHPASGAFFLSERATRLTYANVRWTFEKLSRQVGLRQAGDRRGPRIHDLRHRFAVETLLNWYRQDLDAERHLHELATYLGHVSVANTYWYLQAVPELLELAVRRLESRSEREA